MERTGKNVYEIPERYKAKFKSGTVLNRACEAYGDYLKEEANNKAVNKKMYYCDNRNRVNLMGKLGEDNLPETSPEWCPMADRTIDENNMAEKGLEK